MKVFCYNCRKLVDYTIDTEKILIEVNYVELVVPVAKASCNICAEDVFVKDVALKNIEIIDTRYRDKSHIVSDEQIREVLTKYNITRKGLAQILSLPEDIFDSYLEGMLPDRDVSNSIRELIGSPERMRDLLKQKREKISLLTYEKAMKSIEELELAPGYKDFKKLEEVTWLILEMLPDISIPHALKIAYYIQGFSLILNDVPVFDNSPEAWITGPVYSQVYHKHKHYSYMPNQSDADTFEDVSIAKLVKSEIEIIQAVVNAFAPYSGMILLNMTLSEYPWLSTRGTLDPSVPSNLEIPLEAMKRYFGEVCKQFQIREYKEIEKYSNFIFNKVK